MSAPEKVDGGDHPEDAKTMIRLTEEQEREIARRIQQDPSNENKTPEELQELINVKAATLLQEEEKTTNNNNNNDNNSNNNNNDNSSNNNNNDNNQQGEEEEEQGEHDFGDNTLNPDEIKSILADDSVQGFFQHKGPVYSLAVSPAHEELCLSGDGEETAFLWNITTGEAVASHNDHKDSIISCGFSFDGTLYATASMDGTINVYEAETQALKHTLEGPEEVTFMQWHRKGHVLIAGGVNGMAWMFNAAKGAVMQVFTGHRGVLMSGCFTGDGKRVVTGGEDFSVRIWDPKSAKCLHVVQEGSQQYAPEAPVCCIAAHPTKQLVVSGCVDGRAQIINTANGKIVKQLKATVKLEKKSHKQVQKEAKLGNGEEEADEFGIEAVGFCRAENVFLCSTASLDGQLRIWDVSSGSCRVTCEHDSAVVRTLWHPTLPVIFSCSVDRTVRQWDALTGECLNVWEGATDAILAFAFAPTLGKVVCASDDSQIFVFDTDRGRNERLKLQIKLNQPTELPEQAPEEEGKEKHDTTTTTT